MVGYKEGFDKTYDDLGVNFDSYYYESDTYLIGKDIIDHGLKIIFFSEKKIIRSGLICLRMD